MIMFGAGFMLWLGIPVGWLWVGSQVQTQTGSLGAAVAVMMVGVGISIALMIPVLGWLSERHRASRISRGLDDTGHLALEMVLVTSATITIVVFAAWFLFIAGGSPIPFANGS